MIRKVQAYEILGKRITLWEIEGEYVITNEITGKEFYCFGYAQASDTLDLCIERAFPKGGRS